MNSRRRTDDAWVQWPPVELVAGVAGDAALVPQIPLSSLGHVVHPVHDHTGRLIDWRLLAPAVTAPGAVGEFRRWRSTWLPQWPIGTVSNLAGLLDEVAGIDHGLDRHLGELLQRVVRADGRPVTVAIGSAGALLDELETTRLALSVDERTGSGIVDDTPGAGRSTGLARTWGPVSDEVVLASTPTLAVVLRPGEGLVVLHGGPPHTGFGPVSAVDLRGDVPVVRDAEGECLRLDHHEARPLAWLVPRSLCWHVRPIPIVVVWSLAFHGLREALRAAAAAGDDVVITGDAGIT